MTRCNDLSEQMGVGPLDDDRHDPHDSETPEPCRGCGRRDCGGACPEYIEWLRFSFLVWDAARGGDADARP